MWSDSYWSDIRLGLILCGGVACCYTQEDTDKLVSELQKCGGHKGVVISGCEPWSVSVLKNDTITKEYFHNVESVGKYFKCVKGQWKDKIFFRDERQITMLCSYLEGNVEDEFPIDDCEFVEVKPTWNEV